MNKTKHCNILIEPAGRMSNLIAFLILRNPMKHRSPKKKLSSEKGRRKFADNLKFLFELVSIAFIHKSLM